MNEEQITALIKQMLGESGFLTKNEFNATAAMIRGLKESVESLKGASPLDVLVTMGVLEKTDEGEYKPKATASVPPTPGKEPEWKQAIDALKKSLKTKEDELAAERERAAATEKKNAVMAALSRAGAVKADRDVVHLLDTVSRNDHGAFVCRTKDDVGLDVEVGLDEFVQKFLTENPELMKPSGLPGSGTPAGAVTSTAKPGVISTDDYMANRSKLLADTKVVF